MPVPYTLDKLPPGPVRPQVKTGYLGGARKEEGEGEMFLRKAHMYETLQGQGLILEV